MVMVIFLFGFEGVPVKYGFDNVCIIDLGVQL